ncbi:MerR family DNA-binding protein [Actinomadura kijaniata]|uniref:MerR family DNA-binding protein n=1 Tax=Actinomadura kijaniata TaxID=46161 RepID=UPI0009FF486E|nr:MerR family DNA-binding protein [Actinomadura kijaniata]
MIRMGREAGLGLRELGVVLSADDPKDHADLLREHVARLERRIGRAREAQGMIEHLLACPYRLDECPHAASEIEARLPGPR